MRYGRLMTGVALGGALTAGACQRTGATNGDRSAVDTIFAEDFESGSLAAWQDGVDPTRQVVVSDPAFAQSGERYLAVTYVAGGDGGWLTRWLLPGYDSLFVSYYVRFAPEWTGGTKLIALYGSRSDDRWSAFGKAGICPSGTDFFAAMLIVDPNTESAPGPGPPRFYSYYPDMAREPDGTTCWGRSGNATYGASPPLSGWTRVEFRVRLNGPGRTDASQTFWIDGVEQGHWEGFRFRASDELRLNALQLTFNRGITGAPLAQHLYVDNIVVTTSRQQPQPLQRLDDEGRGVPPAPHFTAIAARADREEREQRAQP